MSYNLTAFTVSIIQLTHILILLFVIFAPFSNTPSLLLYHILLCINLAVHWIFNSDDCILTLMETRIRGVKKTEGIIHKILSPIFNLSKSNFSSSTWIFTLILFSISIGKFYSRNLHIKYFELFKRKFIK